MSETKYTIRQYQDGDEAQIIELLEIVFDRFPKIKMRCSKKDHWAWKSKDAPSGLNPTLVAVNEERKDLNDWFKKIAENVEGLEYKGLYSSWQTDYNWAYLYELEDMGQLQKAMASEGFERDYNKLPAIVTEFWGGPM